jgi:Ni,Fe-hydrogenase III small subunit/ferredoxin
VPWAIRGLRNGVLTTPYPRRPDPYADQFPASLRIRDDATAGDADISTLTALCPTGALRTSDDGRLQLDHGACILCGACVRARPDLITGQLGSETARLSRDALVVPEAPETDQALSALQAELAERVRALRRSVHVRHVDAGSDGAEEWEIQALLGPVYDIHRLGVFFTASPRHADILLVTGTGTHGMAAPLRRTLDGMPRPTVVIAAGTDAISAGLIRPSYATGAGIGALIPVDVWVPGSPPSPFSLLHAILLALGRVPARASTHPQADTSEAGGPR